MDIEENPYQSPQSIDGADPRLQRQDAYGRIVRPYVSGHTRAVCVMSLFAATIALLLLTIGCGVIGMQLWRHLLNGRPDESDSAIRDIIMFGPGIQWLVRLLGVVAIAASFFFLAWIHRVHRNLPALEAGDLKYSPGWAVGYFFIPILNLFRPCQVMLEIWRESDPARLQVPGESLETTKASSAAIVGWWWASFLLIYLVNQGSRPFHDINTVGPIAVLWIGIVSALVSIVAAVVTLVMVYRVDVHQSQRYAILMQSPERRENG
jgi:hypothetical protein